MTPYSPPPKKNRNPKNLRLSHTQKRDQISPTSPYLPPALTSFVAPHSCKFNKKSIAFSPLGNRGACILIRQLKLLGNFWKKTQIWENNTNDTIINLLFASSIGRNRQKMIVHPQNDKRLHNWAKRTARLELLSFPWRKTASKWRLHLEFSNQ